MSWKMTTWAFDQRGLSPSEKIVLLALANWANDDGECYPGQVSIAERCDLSERTVRTVLHSLAEYGLVESEERRRPDGYRTSNLYRLLAPDTSPANLTGDISPAKRRTLTGKPRQPHRQLFAGQEPSVEPPEESSVTTTAKSQNRASRLATDPQIDMLSDLYRASGMWPTDDKIASWRAMSIAAADTEIRALKRDRERYA